MARRFDTDQAEQYVTALRAALTDEDAADFAGIAPDDIRRWRSRNRPFRDRIRRTKAERAIVDAGRVRQAAREDWRASLALAQLAAAERELDRLRELTTDART